jgi:hypothetical protein
MKRLMNLVVALSIVVGTATAANAMSFRTLVNDLSGNSYYGGYYGNPYYGSAYNPYVGYGGYYNNYNYGYPYGYSGYGGYGYPNRTERILNDVGGLLYNFF